MRMKRIWLKIERTLSTVGPPTISIAMTPRLAHREHGPAAFVGLTLYPMRVEYNTAEEYLLLL